MKKLVTILVLCLTFVLYAIGFTACGDEEQNSSDTRNADIVKIYNLYVANAESNGIAPLSYEAWLLSIKGEKGDKGDQGIQGEKGDKGATGIDGVGVKNAEINDNGDLIITLTNDKEINAGKIIDNDNPQGLDFFLRADNTYAVDLGHAALLPSVTIPTEYKGKKITALLNLYDMSDEYLCNNIYYEGTVNEWLAVEKSYDYCDRNKKIYAGGKALSEINELTIQNITEIKEYAFAGFSDLHKLTIENGVTTIKDCAFFRCDTLTSVILPDSVKVIEHRPFCYCNNLTSIKFDGTKDQWNAIEKSSNWNDNSAITQVICTNGTIEL